MNLSSTPASASPKSAERAHRDRPPIEVRRPSFNFRRGNPSRFFFDGNSLKSAFIAAFSCTFPPGEKEFVRSVMHYKDQLPPELMESVRAFAGQEGQHARQHTLANEWLDELGYDATGTAAILEDEIQEWRRTTPADLLLASTVGAEHLTAVLAHFLLTHPEVAITTAPAARELLEWHAVEEIEHKAVAFDVYQHVSGDERKLKIVYLWQLGMFVQTTSQFMKRMLDTLDHTPTPREWLEFADFMLGRGGVLRHSFWPLMRFLRPGFHPWDHDDRELIDAWKSKRAAA